MLPLICAETWMYANWQEEKSCPTRGVSAVTIVIVVALCVAKQLAGPLNAEAPPKHQFKSVKLKFDTLACFPSITNVR